MGKNQKKFNQQHAKDRPKKPREKMVRCPACGGAQPARNAVETSENPSDTRYWCEKCRCFFDLEPDHGDYSDTNPAARLERAERWEAKKREQRNWFQ